jgi:hypothetical protein
MSFSTILSFAALTAGAALVRATDMGALLLCCIFPLLFSLYGHVALFVRSKSLCGSLFHLAGPFVVLM